MPHHIFLSYSRKDSAIMQRVRDDLRAAELSVWTDEGIEPGTHSWKQTIQDAIDNASCLVVILSPDAKKSEWVGRELDYANTQGVPIFPLLASGNEAKSVPFSLIGAQFVDIRKDYPSGFHRLNQVLYDHLKLDPPRIPPPTSTGLPHVPAAILSDDDKLDPWNFFDQARFISWLFLNPAKVHAEYAKSGDDIIRQTVAWIIGAIAWIPFIMIAVGSALGTMDAPGNGLYLVIAGVMYLIGWYATARFGWQAERIRGALLLIMAAVITIVSYWLIGVQAGVQPMTGRTTATAFIIFTTCISIGGGSGLAFRLANSTSGTLAGTIIGTIIYTALSHMELGVAAGLAGISMIGMAVGVRVALDRNLRSSQPSRLGYLMLTILAIDYILMIAVYFLGGWRILNGG